MREFSIRPLVTTNDQSGHEVSSITCNYTANTNIATGSTNDGLRLEDLVTEPGDGASKVDAYVRRVAGPHPNLTVYLVPELDGRPGAQTVYWDEQSEVLLAFCRDKWVGIGCPKGQVYEYHCGRLHDESSASKLLHRLRLPGERIAFRHVDATLRIREAAESTIIFCIFGHTRELVLAQLDRVRDVSWHSLQQKARDRSTSALNELSLAGWSASVDQILKRSCLVLDVLTNRETGGTIAGPDVQSGIESAPGYAAVWGRDAAWTLLGALAMGCTSQAERMLQFAFKTQSPEGLWIHRHHTDYTTASSWCMHQIDETGILLHSIRCYVEHTDAKGFAREHWHSIKKAADFLVSVVDHGTSLPCKSIDLWEEREGIHLYTAASVIAGLRAAVCLSHEAVGTQDSAISTWSTTADKVLSATLTHFWSDELGRFITSLESSSGLPMIDTQRPELSAVVQSGDPPPKTALAQYPNWRDGRVISADHRHDISMLALAIPFAILPVTDKRISSTAEKIRETLRNKDIGGLARYEGDTYGGGNPWPLATLWMAMYEGLRGDLAEAQATTEWVINHTTAAGLVPEQVDRFTGKPIAAVPLSWSHGMIALAVGASLGQNVWIPKT